MDSRHAASATARTVIAALALAAVITLAACGGSASAITGHGTLTVYADALSGQTTQDAYPDITSGSQVTVTDTSGKVIGAGTLSYDSKQTTLFLLEAQATAKSGLTATELAPFVAIYDFTVTAPGGMDRYGIEAGRNRGTIWFTAAQMKSEPRLTLGSLSSGG